MSRSRLPLRLAGPIESHVAPRASAHSNERTGPTCERGAQTLACVGFVQHSIALMGMIARHPSGESINNGPSDCDVSPHLAEGSGE